MKNFDEEEISLIGFLDSNSSLHRKKYMGFPVLGGLEQVKKLKDDVLFCNCITRTTEDRKQISDEIIQRGGELYSLIDPEIDLEFVKLGKGVYIQEATYLQAGVEIGDNVSIHMGTMIGHGAKIGKNSILTFACNVSGGVKIEEGVAAYTGANIVGEIKIGKWSIIGAGSVVRHDIPKYSLAVGNPAQVIRKLERGHGIH